MERSEPSRRDVLEATERGAVPESAAGTGREANGGAGDADGGGAGAGGGASRRGVLRSALAGGLALGGLSVGVGTDTAAAGSATRTELQRVSEGEYLAIRSPEGIRLAIYRAQTDRTAAVDLFFRKSQKLLGQLYEEDIITGYEVALYDTDRDSVDNNKGEDWGAYDVGRILEEEGWTDEDVGLWFTGRAKVWNESAGSYEWQDVGGGAAGYQTGFDPDSKSEIAPCWMSTDNEDDRVVAHGASMELMHALTDGGLDPVGECHGGHGEHSLGNAIYEYNEDYGTSGFFGSPIASGPHTWEKGPCSSGVDEKTGITFTLTPCTKRAVEYTKRDRVEDLSLGSGNGCGRPQYLQEEHVLTIEGTSWGFDDYTLRVGGSLEQTTDNGATIDSGDEVTTASDGTRKAEGSVWTGTDSYRFQGRIAEFTCEDLSSVTVTLDGQEVRARSLDADVVLIDGSVEDGWNQYELGVTAGLRKDDVEGASVNDHDDVDADGTHVSGWTKSGTDAYRFYGGVTRENTDLSAVGVDFL